MPVEHIRLDMTKKHDKNSHLMIKQRFLSISLRFHRHIGFSLIEVGLAIIVVATVLVTGISSVFSALNLQIEADRLALAMSLAQTKMAELRSQSKLPKGDSSEEISDKDNVYYGYRWEVSVRDDKINILKAFSGDDEGGGLEGLLPDSVQNEAKDNGSSIDLSKGFFAIGDIPILRITVMVEYPKGRGIYGKYKVESLQKSDQKFSIGR